jgi:hypothetical protein
VSVTDPEPGRYICLRTASLFGYLIRAVTRSPVDHAVVVLEGGKCAEATVRGTRIDDLAKYAGALAVSNTAEDMTGAQRMMVCATAESYAGREYGWSLIAAIALRKLGVKPGWLMRILDDKDALICSELVCIAGQSAGLNWACGESSAEYVEPSELALRDVMRPVTIT